MSTSRLLAESFAPVLDFIYPPRCPACGSGVGEQGGLCSTCWSDLVIPSDPCCAACQRPFGDHGPQTGAICAPCLADPPAHDGIAAGTLYTDTSRRLVLAFKHGRRIALALHSTRLWHRGYNQAALLGRQLQKMGHGTMCVDALMRTRPTPALGGLGKRARARTLQGAITLRRSRKARIEDAEVILVDDVLTSGATSTACVKALKRGGAASVTIACFSRVLDEALAR